MTGSIAGRTVLVIGAARSGKSRHAEALVGRSGGGKVYLATAEAGDGEMSERIAAHRDRRGPDWRTVEEPLDLAGALGREAGEGRVTLVDCLTLWLSNLMAAGRDWQAETGRLAALLPALPGLTVIVTNEVGAGIVPANALARRFADAHGVLNQTIAAVADEVILVVAGLPLTLKSTFRETAA